MRAMARHLIAFVAAVSLTGLTGCCWLAPGAWLELAEGCAGCNLTDCLTAPYDIVCRGGAVAKTSQRLTPAAAPVPPRSQAQAY
jgi:hypothetical protein